MSETWVCPDCGQKYVSPIRVDEVAHDCPKRFKLRKSGQFKKEEEDE